LLLIFEEPLKEYVRTVQAIKVVMADRAQAYRQHRELTESSKLKELNLEKLKLLRPDKAGEVEAEVTEIKAQSDEAKLRYEEIVRLMEKEMVQFQEAKTRDLGLVLHDFACAQAQLASDTADAWRTLLPYLDNPHLGESTVTESG
jgi:sorting nexin-1/2